MPCVEAVSLAGTSLHLEDCVTVGDVMVKIAVLNQRLATEIAIINPVCGKRLENSKGTPPKVSYVILKEDVDKMISHSLYVNMLLHAEQNDIPRCALMLQQLRIREGDIFGENEIKKLVKFRRRNWKTAMFALMEVGISGHVALISAVVYENFVAFDALLSHLQFTGSREAHAYDQALACVVDVRNSELRSRMANALISAGASLHSLYVLDVSSARGYADIVKILLVARAAVNVGHCNLGTALIAASTHGHLEVVGLLLEAGADIERCDKFGRTSLAMASFNGHVKVVEALVAAGARPPLPLAEK